MMILKFFEDFSKNFAAFVGGIFVFPARNYIKSFQFIVWMVNFLKK